MLPVLLGTESWVYPIAVFVLVLFLILGQIGMERAVYSWIKFNIRKENIW